MSVLPTCDKDEETASARLMAVSERGIGSDKVMDMYKNWAENYDKDLDLASFHPEHTGVKKAVEFMTHLKNSRVLDVAAGTGNMGAALQKEGFSNLDALDGSQEMLDVAGRKGIYKNLIHSMMGAEYTLPIENDTYDGITMTGAFVPGHVGGDCYPELIRIIKPGGIIMVAFNERYLEDSKFQEDVEGTAYSLQDKGLWKIVERAVSPNYQGNWGEKNNNGVTFVFKKL